jgi:hypothetical protein
VSTATAVPANGSWKSAEASPALSSGQYTATATQTSSLGNPPGVSAAVSFTVETAAPKVTLEAPVLRSNNTKPTFTGTASDTTPVTVQIHLAKDPHGAPLATATTSAGGDWKSGEASPALLQGKNTYIAIATEPSSLGNPPGTSEPVTFTVDTEAPSVAMEAPSAWTNSATPTFTGTASENTPVTVQIYAGEEVKGLPMATALSPTGGRWTADDETPLPDGRYTVNATQVSEFGNHVGETAEYTFMVDTIAPRVTLTPLPTGSATSNGSQRVEGHAGAEQGDLTSVTAQLFSGSTIAEGQQPVQSITVNASAGAWSATFAGLQPGTYTARAEQSDEAGNVGLSAPTTFVVTGTGSSTEAAQSPAPPAASFTWFPSRPRTYEAVSLASSSTDASSPITTFAWDLAGSGTFVTESQVMTTTFSTPGNHSLRLRVTAADGLSSIATETIPVISSGLPLMQPFPVVRIASTDTASGIRLILLRVQAPAGARIVVECKGHSCPAKSESRLAAAGKIGVAPVEFRRFERSLRAGVLLQIRVYKAGEIGKFTSFEVRRRRLPLRVDTCVGPDGLKPIACP